MSILIVGILVWTIFLIHSEAKLSSWKKPFIGSKKKKSPPSRKFDVEAANSNGKPGLHAYEDLVHHFVRTDQNRVFRDHSEEEILRVIEGFASLQSAWKSMDGATHRLRNTVKTRYLQIIFVF
jgi:hypothetical protein